MEMGEPRQLVVTCPQCGDNKVILARQIKKEVVESNPVFSEFLQVSRDNSPVGFVRRTSTFSIILYLTVDSFQNPSFCDIVAAISDF